MIFWGQIPGLARSRGGFPSVSAVKSMDFLGGWVVLERGVGWAFLGCFDLMFWFCFCVLVMFSDVFGVLVFFLKDFFGVLVWFD